ncbi:MAG: hypothetical protein JW751_10635 [Polyangiaceae bacterium]|nr:hypothetical protein [Polyangiaceae bacterium]
MAKQTRQRTTPWLAAGAALVAAVLASPTAGAQTLELPRPRQGYYLGGGFQLALVDIFDTNESLGIWPGNLLKLRTGEMLTNQLGLGLSLEFGGATKEPKVATFGSLKLEGQWEFARNLALHGGVGMEILSLVDTDYPNDPRRGSYGGIYSFGLSYDWFFYRRRLQSGGWSVQPVATFSYLPGDPVRSFIFVFGAEILRWRGLPQNELKLPEGEGYGKKNRKGR